MVCVWILLLIPRVSAGRVRKSIAKPTQVTILGNIPLFSDTSTLKCVGLHLNWSRSRNVHIRCQFISYSIHQRQVSRWRGHVVELTLADLHLNPMIQALKVDLSFVPQVDGRMWPIVYLHPPGQLLAGIADVGQLDLSLPAR